MSAYKVTLYNSHEDAYSPDSYTVSMSFVFNRLAEAMHFVEEAVENHGKFALVHVHNKTE